MKIKVTRLRLTARDVGRSMRARNGRAMVVVEHVLTAQPAMFGCCEYPQSLDDHHWPVERWYRSDGHVVADDPAWDLVTRLNGRVPGTKLDGSDVGHVAVLRRSSMSQERRALVTRVTGGPNEPDGCWMGYVFDPALDEVKERFWDEDGRVFPHAICEDDIVAIESGRWSRGWHAGDHWVLGDNSVVRLLRGVDAAMDHWLLGVCVVGGLGTEPGDLVEWDPAGSPRHGDQEASLLHPLEGPATAAAALPLLESFWDRGVTPDAWRRAARLLAAELPEIADALRQAAAVYWWEGEGEGCARQSPGRPARRRSVGI